MLKLWFIFYGGRDFAKSECYATIGIQGRLTNEYPVCKDRCEGFIMYFAVSSLGEWGE